MFISAEHIKGFESLPEHSYLHLADVLFQIYSCIQVQSVKECHYTLIKKLITR